MAKQPEKTTSKSEASPEAREAPVLKTNALKWQSEGFAWREAFVRLPQEALFSDLQDDPTIWRNIQAVPQTALRKFDRVTIVAFDESWIAKEILVADADNQRVLLALRPTDKITLPSKSSSWEDERHAIRWAGAGFGVFRRADGIQVMPQQFGTIESAKSEMYRQFYVTKVA